MPVGARKIAFSVRWKIKKDDWVIREKAFIYIVPTESHWLWPLKSMTLMPNTNDFGGQSQCFFNERYKLLKINVIHIYKIDARRGGQKVLNRWRTNAPSAQTEQGLVGANYPTRPCERWSMRLLPCVPVKAGGRNRLLSGWLFLVGQLPARLWSRGCCGTRATIIIL